MRPLMTVAAIALLVSGCATKWDEAPSTLYPGQHLETKVLWLPRGQGQYELLAYGQGMACCMIPQDEIRDPIIEGANRKAKELCGTASAMIADDSYDPRTGQYGARVICR